MEEVYVSSVKVTDARGISLMEEACRSALLKGGMYTLTAKYNDAVGSVIEYRIYLTRETKNYEKT